MSKETHITCDFPGGGGGSGPPNPPLDPHVGSPDATVCLQNHDLSLKKYHPTTTKTEKKLSPADRDSKCGSRGGSGGPDPPGKSRYMGFYWTPWKKLDPPLPPGKYWIPSGTLKNDSFL